MSSRKSYFGTDGIRGHVNQAPMTAHIAQALGAAVVSWMKETHPEQNSAPVIGIGSDTRRSCPMLSAALASGAASMGSNVYQLGVLPTPAVSWWTQQQPFAMGVVISASHNPYQDNGIKLFASSGYKLSDEDELKIEAKLEQWLSNELPLPEAEEVGQIESHGEVAEQYTVHLAQLWQLSDSLKGYRLVIDAAHGAGYAIAPKLFEALGAEVVAIGVEPNGLNINKECGATHTKALQQAVVEHQAAAGIALDGDADRLIAVDDKGQEVDGDQIIAICAPYMKEQGTLPHDLVVVTVMSNLGLEHCLTKHGIQLLRTQVGDRYVIEQMRAKGASLGGEQSGHLIFSNHSTTGDGLLAAIQLLQIMVARQQPLSELAAAMDRYPQVLKNVVVREKKPWDDIPSIREAIALAEEKMDGKGRILVRYSGTQNRARIMLEGPNASLLAQLANEIAQEFEAQLGV